MMEIGVVISLGMPAEDRKLVLALSEGATAGDAAARLAQRFSSLGEIIFDRQTGQPAGRVLFMLNDSILSTLDIEVKNGDTLQLLPVITGG